jgi:ATP-dependent DNA ligase
MVLPHADGRCDFYGLPSAIGDGRDGELLVWAFDLLWHTGEDLRGRPLLERKAALADVVAAAGVDCPPCSEMAPPCSMPPIEWVSRAWCPNGPRHRIEPEGAPRG